MWTKSALDISWIFLSARPDARPSTSPEAAPETRPSLSSATYQIAYPTARPEAHPAPFQAHLSEPLPAALTKRFSTGSQSTPVCGQIVDRCQCQALTKSSYAIESRVIAFQSTSLNTISDFKLQHLMIHFRPTVILSAARFDPRHLSDYYLGLPTSTPWTCKFWMCQRGPGIKLPKTDGMPVNYYFW